MRKPVIEREMNGGIQKIFRFDNNRGASVVKHDFSYGRESGLWELAVIKYSGDGMDNWKIDYDSGLSDDVEGSLSDDDVELFLEKIENLK